MLASVVAVADTEPTPVSLSRRVPRIACGYIWTWLHPYPDPVQTLCGLQKREVTGVAA